MFSRLREILCLPALSKTKGGASLGPGMGQTQPREQGGEGSRRGMNKPRTMVCMLRADGRAPFGEGRGERPRLPRQALGGGGSSKPRYGRRNAVNWSKGKPHVRVSRLRPSASSEQHRPARRSGAQPQPSCTRAPTRHPRQRLVSARIVSVCVSVCGTWWPWCHGYVAL